VFANPNEAIAYALRTSKIMVHRFVDDLKPNEFEHQPMPGTNCAAWVIGHLIRTDRRTLRMLGVTDLPAVDEGFEDRFGATRTAAAAQSGFGDPMELVRLFDTHRDRLIAAVLATDPAKFREETELKHPLFADKGEAAAFMGLHTAMHMGQITLIRRSLGYPPVS
jgi:hypothetical protein